MTGLPLRATRRGLVFAILLVPHGAGAVETPRILADGSNRVPACVTPTALMGFVRQRNAALDPPRMIEARFDGLADYYKRIGNCVDRPPERCVGIRWDYAFFQMLVETNYITFRKPDGAPGGVPPQDNNFAGVGATIPGRPGERFRDIATGVLAHLQHVLMYSLTRIPNPVANRTRQVQADVQDDMRRLGHPITFTDLATEWTGTDQSTYARDMRAIADRFAARYCSGAVPASGK